MCFENHFLMTNYEGILNFLGVLYVDRICTEERFVENRIKKFPSVQQLQWFIYDTYLFFSLRVISLELCIDLGPQCNILGCQSWLKISGSLDVKRGSDKTYKVW